jgi:hypothetical protein
MLVALYHYSARQAYPSRGESEINRLDPSDDHQYDYERQGVQETRDDENRGVAMKVREDGRDQSIEQDTSETAHSWL